MKFLLFEKPDVVFGMGGYSSFPVCLAAKILKIPFIIYENNLIIGKANSYLAPFSKKILVSNKNLEGILEKYYDRMYGYKINLRAKQIIFKGNEADCNDFISNLILEKKKIIP